MAKSTLTFTNIPMTLGNLGHESEVPDLLPNLNFQNKNSFKLDEFDEIYEGYGKLPNAFPYPKITNYTRDLLESTVKAAILENDALYAVFLPEFGGRLWQLNDKRSNRDLLFTNDVLRFSNLAVRDAWFAGGVEWNCGVIGHTPLSSSPIFAAQTETNDGEPVLRMYAFERIRRVVYQMDFWLDAEKLNARFRISNQNDELVPMYWWSNIAVPEYPQGRLIFSAKEAYTAEGPVVSKVSVPLVDGVDIAHYCDIPGQVDYFFNIPTNQHKFIASVGADGFGLLQESTARLQSRKLFSWGNNAGSERWQTFLSEDAGRYVEIQAGLGKTQYGCLPLAANTTWEWSEQYSAIQLNEAELALDTDELNEHMEKTLASLSTVDLAHSDGADFAKKHAELKMHGNGDALAENVIRFAKKQKPLQEHLDFSSDDKKPLVWLDFLRSGKLAAPTAGDAPTYFVSDPFWLDKLLAATRHDTSDNWFVRYNLGILYEQLGDTKRAKKHLKKSLDFERNAWNLHALSVLFVQEDRGKKAAKLILEGLSLAEGRLAYVKEALTILALCAAFEQMLSVIAALPAEQAADARVQFSRAEALYACGRFEEAMAILEEGEGLLVPDIREGDLAIGALWQKLNLALGGDPNAEVPFVFNFDAFVD